MNHVACFIMAVFCSVFLCEKSCAQNAEKDIEKYKKIMAECWNRDYQFDLKISSSSYFKDGPLPKDTMVLEGMVAKYQGQYLTKQGSQLFFADDSVALIIDNTLGWIKILNDSNQIVTIRRALSGGMVMDSMFEKTLLDCNLVFSSKRREGSLVETISFISKERSSKNGPALYEGVIEVVDHFPEKYRIVTRTAELVMREDMEPFRNMGIALIPLEGKDPSGQFAVIKENIIELKLFNIKLGRDFLFPFNLHDYLVRKNDGQWKPIGVFAQYTIVEE